MSIHCNAAGNGSAWMGAKGWSVFVSNNASTNSKLLADCLYDAAEQQKLRLEPKDLDRNTGNRALLYAEILTAQRF